MIDQRQPSLARCSRLMTPLELARIAQAGTAHREQTLRVYVRGVAYFADGSPYSYFKPDGSVNVGWLDAHHPFPVGDAPPDFAPNLVRACRQSVNRTRGLHFCELCPPETPVLAPKKPGLVPVRVRPPEANIVRDHEGDFKVGGAEIRVPAMDGVVYAAPDMIVHYVLAHRYLPPTAFVEAVITTTTTRSFGDRWLPL